MQSKFLTLLLLSIPAIALASGGEAANPWKDIAFKFVNFAILLGAGYYFLKNVIPQALKDRKEGVAKELTAALKAKETAEASLAEYKAKVANMEAEIAKLKSDFAAEGEAQKTRIIEEAKAQAENIAKNAKAAGEREAKKAIDEIKAEAVKEALLAAEKILSESYGAADQERALKKTIEKIEGLH